MLNQHLHCKVNIMNISIFKIITIVLPVSLLLAGCASEGARQTKAAGSDQDSLITVKTSPVRQARIHYTRSLPGELYPYEEVQLYAKIRGFVNKMYVDRGSPVKQGQLLASLEAPEIMQQYVAAQAKQREVQEQLQYSLQAYRRMEEAAQQEGAVAAIELDEAQARVRRDSASYLAFQAEMEAAEQLSHYTMIRAPFDGVITRRNVSQGALVGENDRPLFTLSQQDRLRLTIAVPEKHAHAIQDSTKVTFTVNGQPGKTFRASMSRSSRVLDPALRSLMVEFDIANTDGQLSGGEYAKVQLQLEKTGATLQVPVSSLVQSQTGSYVIKVDNQTIHHVPVEVGIRQDSLIEVFGALQEGDQVAVKGSGELRDGMSVASQPISLNQ